MKNSLQKILIGFLALGVYNLLVYMLYVVESNFETGNINNIADAYWYSLVTLTTVGYGDFFPITFWGRLIGILFILGSLGILGYLLTEISVKIKAYLKKRDMGLLGTKMTGHCVIIGWNAFSKQVAEQIIKAKEPVAVVVNREEDLNQIRQLYGNDQCFVLVNEMSDFASLEKANITQSKRVYVNFENDTDTLVFTISLKKQFSDVNCVVAIDNIELKESFNYLGIQYIIPKKEIISKFIASYIFEPNVALMTEDLISTSMGHEDLDICEIRIPADSPLVNKSYLDIFVEQKKENNIVLLGVSRAGILIKNPEAELVLLANDILVFIGNDKSKQFLN